MTVVLGIVWIILMLYFGSGMWARVSRHRSLTEDDYLSVEDWRVANSELSPGKDIVLVSTDMVPLDDDERAGGPAPKRLLLRSGGEGNYPTRSSDELA